MNDYDFIKQVLSRRITDDERYAKERLGRHPVQDEVNVAIGYYGDPDSVLERAVDAVAETLDQFEAEVWDNLKERMKDKRD